jgi:O-antigen ligase
VFEHLSPPLVIGSPALASHNVYVQILAEQGLVGALVVAAIVVSLLWEIWQASGPWRDVGLAMVLTFLIQSAFINSTQSIQVSGITWVVAAAAVAGGRRWAVARAREA